MSKLLESTKAREKFVNGIKKHGFFISVSSYIIGIIWMIALPYHEFSASNYFSENQLLPGLVDTYFSLDHYTHRLHRSFKALKCENASRSIKDRIKNEFNELGFDVYEQNFQVPSQSTNGSNVYGILRSPRAPGVESLILNVPLYSDCSSTGSLALMVSLAMYFRDQSYWAKDVIFLVTENNLYGTQAWLNGYFNDHTPDILAENLYGRGGSIQAAITLDFESHVIDYLDVLYVGSNGLLPNLDLIHVVNRIANMEGVPSKFQYQSQLFQHKEEFFLNLQSLMRMISTQSSGYPSGNHGLFYKYRIEAVTLHGVQSSKGRYRRVEFGPIGRMMEGIFRSANNMLEHFHQSFFLYVLPNTYTYISIGMYMPPVGCIVLSLAVHLILLWIDIFKLDQQEGATVKEPHLVTMSPLLNGDIIKRLSLSYLLSVCCYFGLQYFFDNLTYYSPAGNHLFSVLMVTLFIAVTTVVMIQNYSKNEVLSNHRFFGLLLLGIVILVISIFNFSAAFVIAVFHVPFALSVSAQGGKLRKILQIIFSLLSSPPVLILIVCMSSEITFKDFDLVKLVDDVVPKWRRVVVKSHLDSVLRIWTKDVYYFTVLPIWITLTSICFSSK